MTVTHCLDVCLWLIIAVFHIVGSDVTFCPRSLYDCDSLEARLHSSADVIITPEFMTSSHEESYIDEICKFFKSQECSEPILAQCKGEVVYATQTFKARQQYICGDRFTRKGMSTLKSCTRQFSRHFTKCQQKRQTKLEEVTYVTQTSATTHPWCNLTNDYLVCVYSVMALGCTLDVAEKYMETFNHSSPVVEAIYGYGCAFSHPLDHIKTTALPADTTSQGYGRQGGYSYGSRSSGSSRSRGLASRHTSDIVLHISCLLVYVVWCLTTHRCQSLSAIFSWLPR